MPDPREVFDNPKEHWELITSESDNAFEHQYYDRKEAGRVGTNGFVSSTQLARVQGQIQECISAFANANHEGGLVVVGVSSTGEIKGIGHLQESQVNQLTSFDKLLRNQAAMTRLADCENAAGNSDQILLIYVPFAAHGICETMTSPAKAWIRQGKQNRPVDDQMREQLKRDKKIVDFERAYCCPFHIDDVDTDVLEEFRKVFLKDTTIEYDDEQLLYAAGAIERDNDGYSFNNAGLLFFAINPQRVLPWAYIRLLRFEADSQDVASRGLHTLDRNFDGSIPQQIRKMRAFFRESGFFKVYQKRNPEGGFIDDPELPYIAVDEAVVNAVVHRDYGGYLPQKLHQ